MEANTSTRERVGHGSIRLRRQDPQSTAADLAGAGAAQAPAIADGPVGHGTIRLRDSAPAADIAVEAAAYVEAAALVEVAPRVEVAPQPEPEPEPDLVGHGSIRLLDRTLQLPLDATLAAEADILELLTANA